MGPRWPHLGCLCSHYHSVYAQTELLSLVITLHEVKDSWG